MFNVNVCSNTVVVVGAEIAVDVVLVVREGSLVSRMLNINREASTHPRLVMK